MFRMNPKPIPAKNLELQKHLFDFLKNRNKSINTNSRTYSRVIRFSPVDEKNKVPDDENNYYIKNYINESSFSDIRLSDMLEFSKYLQTRKDGDALAIKFLIDKMPTSKHMDYSQYMNKTMDLFEKNPKAYFTYVGRLKVLEHNIEKLPEIFNIINKNEERVAIIQMIATCKSFRLSANIQATVYNLAKQYLEEPEKYEALFPKVPKVKSNSIELENVAFEKILEFNIDLVKVNASFLEKEWGTGKVAGALNKFAEHCTDHCNTLGIRKIEVNAEKNTGFPTTNKSTMNVKFIGQHIENELLSSLTQNFLKLYLSELNSSDFYRKEESLTLFENALVKARYELLQSDLPETIKKTSHRSKI